MPHTLTQLNAMRHNGNIYFNEARVHGNMQGVNAIISAIYEREITVDELNLTVENMNFYIDLINRPDINEVHAWEEIQGYDINNGEQQPILRTKINNYIETYPGYPQNHLNEARQLLTQLDRQAEARVWDNFNLNEQTQLNPLFQYLSDHPNTIHRGEVDDRIWNIITQPICIDDVRSYICDLPQGRHIDEARAIVQNSQDWNGVDKQDIFAIHDFTISHRNSPFIAEAQDKLEFLKNNELAAISDNPIQYDVQRLKELIDKEILSKDSLIQEDLLTEDVWEKIQRLGAAKSGLVQNPNPDLAAPEGHTDVFFFGIPSTGKTCILMGLLKNTNRFTFNTRLYGGEYACQLLTTLNHGKVPGRTVMNFVTLINGQLFDPEGKENGYHPVNLIEMAGEDFAFNIANNRENSLEDMGLGATQLLSNKNRKVFFFIIDPTTQEVTFNHRVVVGTDNNGNEIGEIRRVEVDQSITLQKMVDLLSLRENAHIMERVDAIHIIVTKADTLGKDRKTREDNASQLFRNQYNNLSEPLKALCRNRINKQTDYRPHIFTFSLGKFYVGNICAYDETDTKELLDVIRANTGGVKPLSLWDNFKNILTH